jgi:hypothetical protein
VEKRREKEEKKCGTIYAYFCQYALTQSFLFPLIIPQNIHTMASFKPMARATTFAGDTSTTTSGREFAMLSRPSLRPHSFAGEMRLFFVFLNVQTKILYSVTHRMFLYYSFIQYFTCQLHQHLVVKA